MHQPNLYNQKYLHHQPTKKTQHSFHPTTITQNRFTAILNNLTDQLKRLVVFSNIINPKPFIQTLSDRTHLIPWLCYYSIPNQTTIINPASKSISDCLAAATKIQKLEITWP